MTIQSDLQTLIERTVQQMGYEFVGIELIQHAGTLIRVYVDTDGGISLDALQSISGQLGSVLDVEDKVRGRYTLEVSSPGVDRILFTLAHYQRFIGHCIKVRMEQAIDGRANFKGILKAATEQDIELEIEGQVVKLARAQIKRARLVPDLDKG